jgi:small subunit ribosomal protein S1
MFTSILNAYNPKDKRSYGVLRLFAEGLSESERLKFVELIFEKGSWILPTEISKTSNSIELKEISNIKFYQIFDKWVKKRIEHSSQIPISSKDPFITNVLITDFRELLLSLRNLNFSPDLLTIFDNLFDNCNPFYFKKFLQNAISFVIEDYNESELELFFQYFSDKYIEKQSTNYSTFVYIFLHQLAFSYKIHDLSEVFLNHLEKLAKTIKDSKNNNNYNLLISVLLIDLIKNKKLDLSNSDYDLQISDSLNTLEKGEQNNLDFYKFLKQFNYSFNKYSFNLEIDILLRKLNDIIQILKNSSDQHKKDTLNHYIKLSDKYFEYFLFFLEHCSEKDTEKYFFKFINLTDELRSSFSELLWFDEFLNFKMIKGNVTSKITNGFEVKIEEFLFNQKAIEKKLDSKLSPDFILQNGFGFLKQSYINENSNIEDLNSFYISTINYSIFNKGKIISLVPSTKALNEITNRFELKALFPSVELYLIEKAHEYLNLESPFSKKGNALKQLILPDFIEDFNFNFSVESFWNMLKTIRPSLYDSIYIKHQKNEESFKKIVSAYENNQTISGLINFRGSGGMSVDVFGIEAFLPGSQIDLKPIRDYDHYLNKVMDFKILKINAQTKNIVISHKALIEKENDNKKSEFIKQLVKGQIVEGIVKNITSYGVFVDLGFVDGLIHITDLTWYRINHPSDVLELDQKLKVLVLDFDEDKTKIQLGLKQLDSNTLVNINELKEGQIVNGEIAIITEYGVFVKIEGGIEGLIHVSELTWSTIPHIFSERRRFIQKLYSIGDQIKAKILNIDTEEYKISLSIKQLQVKPWDSLKNGFKIRSKVKGKVTHISHLGVTVELAYSIVGFIKISEISWLKVPTKRDEQVVYIQKALSLKDKIEGLVLYIDNVDQKILLSLKRLKINPWHNLIKSIKRGDILEGKVVKIVEFGVFIELINGLEGLLSIHNMTRSKIPENKKDRYALIQNILNIGDVIDVVVLKINNEKHQISFGLKQLHNYYNISS